MTLLEQWREMAYDDKKSPQAQQMFWANYFNLEKGVYIDLLKSYGEPVKGTVKELAENYNFDIMTMVGFLDGINDSLKNPNPIETMDENTKVSLCFDKELLYKNMVERNSIKNRNFQQQLLRDLRFQEMIHVLAEAVLNIRNAVARTHNFVNNRVA